MYLFMSNIFITFFLTIAYVKSCRLERKALLYINVTRQIETKVIFIALHLKSVS